jgi:hypothetical protein
MIYRFSTLALSALLSLCSVSSNAQGFGIIIDSLELGPNQIGCVAVRSVGFTDIVSFQYSLTWDSTVLAYDHIQNPNIPNWTSEDYNQVNGGTLLIGWADMFGQARTIADTTVHYEACFKAIGVLGSHSDIVPGSNGFFNGTGGAEAFNDDFEELWTDSLIVNGYINIGVVSGSAGIHEASERAAIAFQLAPNPSPGVTQISLTAEAEGPAQISVSDALGREVYGQQVRVLVGENKFEIPANVLTAKGMYQVSLRTKSGTSTQILSVQ